MDSRPATSFMNIIVVLELSRSLILKLDNGIGDVLWKYACCLHYFRCRVNKTPEHLMKYNEHDIHQFSFRPWFCTNWGLLPLLVVFLIHFPADFSLYNASLLQVPDSQRYLKVDRTWVATCRLTKWLVALIHNELMDGYCEQIRQMTELNCIFLPSLLLSSFLPSTAEQSVNLKKFQQCFYLQ